MHAKFQTLGLLALTAGTALALPGRRGGSSSRGCGTWRDCSGTGNHEKVPVVTVVVTYTATAAPPQTETPEPTVAPTPAPEEPTTTETPTSTATASPEPSEPAADAASWQSIVAKWRTNLGLPALEENETLVSNAYTTAFEGHGQMVHQLLPGTFGQVLAPGGPDDFEHVFVGGWLCERPDLEGLNDICETEGEGWIHDSTGHADILTNTDYTMIGCANAEGIWACDLGY